MRRTGFAGEREAVRDLESLELTLFDLERDLLLLPEELDDLDLLFDLDLLRDDDLDLERRVRFGVTLLRDFAEREPDRLRDLDLLECVRLR